MEEDFVLPTAKVAAVRKNPQNLIIFSKPKTGKTSLVAQLPNCLILEFEPGGADYVDAMKIQIEKIEDLNKVYTAIKKAGKPYQYIAVDTITALEEMVIPLAEKLYMATPQGVNWDTPVTGGKAKYGNILQMPQGAGYAWLRTAFDKAVDLIKQFAPNIILLGHVKDSMLEKNGKEFNSSELDLTGKIKRIATSKSDAVGYLYRKGKNNYLSFLTSDEVSCGARPTHLANKEILLSEYTETGEYLTHWDKIYLDETTK